MLAVLKVSVLEVEPELLLLMRRNVVGKYPAVLSKLSERMVTLPERVSVLPTPPVVLTRFVVLAFVLVATVKLLPV